MNNRIYEIAQKYGFEIENVRELSEINASLYQMKYIKNNAQLVWLKRDDENKTFAITFKTIPQNDTGVFHILEHSVLCGSKKYPMKEPFVELVKSSMQTFLNAFTFPDKTMYPLSTKNNKDFLNLMDVYLDAVFHPLSLEREETFLQEGWHYEINSQGEIIYNGVVYNEMKGAMASADNIITSEIRRRLFPDNSYQFESGGKPSHIPELTYEEYIQAHNQYYHPSNARFFLDGDIKIEDALAKIDGFLNEYEELTLDFDLEIQEQVEQEESTCYYKIGENENPEQKVILSESFVCGLYDEPEKNIACSILSEVLCMTAEDPLKKVILENQLAENVELLLTDGILQPYVSLIVRNTCRENKEKIWEIIKDTLKSVARTGLNKERLNSVINRMEFRIREQDYGNMPKGIVYAMRVMESWLYGGDPAQNLCYDEIFKSLREKVNQGYFEELLCEVFLNNKHHVKVCLVPSKTLEKEEAKAEKKRLKMIEQSWNDEEKRTILDKAKKLKEYQTAKDSKENLAKLPILDLSDIPEKVEFVQQKATYCDGNLLLKQNIDTNGILYAKLYISLHDQSIEKLRMISLLSMLLGYISTENYSETQLSTVLGNKLGRFEVQTRIIEEQDNMDTCTPYLTVGISVIQDKKEDAIDLIKEILLNPNFEEGESIKNKIQQLLTFYERQIIMYGDRYAAMHVASAFSAEGYVREETCGINMLRWLRALNDNYDEKKIAKQFYELCRNIFVRERITLSIAGNVEEAWIHKLLESFPRKENVSTKVIAYEKNNITNGGLQIPVDICFATQVSNFNLCGEKYSGAMKVAAHILTYDYLWKEIRVKGGAYGCRVNIFDNGNISFTSFRDPNPQNALECFKKAGKALLKICETEENIDKYIISTITETDPLMSARAKSDREAENYLCGETKEKRQKIREEILHTSKADLKECARILEAANSNAQIYVVGSKSILEKCKEYITQIESL